MSEAPTDRATPAGPVLGIFAHPDDAEISCSGTLSKWVDAGRDVHLLILTNGDRGSGDPSVVRAELAATRAEEATRAGEVLGLAGVDIFSTPDGELENTPLIREPVVRRIRELRPDTIASLDPTTWFIEDSYFNHADHRRAGEVALDAIFPGAGNPHYFVEQLAEGLEPWSVHDVWLAWTNEPNHHEDVTATFPRKLEALSQHSTQVHGGMLGFFEQEMDRDARAAGDQIGVEFAESFRVLTLD